MGGGAVLYYNCPQGPAGVSAAPHSIQLLANAFGKAVEDGQVLGPLPPVRLELSSYTQLW